MTELLKIIKKTSTPAEAKETAPETEPETAVDSEQVETVADSEQDKPEQVEAAAETEQETADDSEQTESSQYPDALFQAIGVIVGEVNFAEDGTSTITIGGKVYKLFYVKQKRAAFFGLQKDIEANGNNHRRLIVYPRVIHFPKKTQPHAIAFQLVGFKGAGDSEGVLEELGDNEFKLRGLWQFIPVCRTPCISVLRNFNKERLDYVKQAEPEQKVRFMKASHLPLLWKDSPVRPFRFNPKAGKDQGHPAFVQVKARLLYNRDVFGFVELLAPPMEKAPRFLKASKKDKASLRDKASSKDKASLKQGGKKPKPKPSKKAGDN